MSQRLGRLKDKVALVTGAAQGLGRSIAQVLAGEGASVVVADLQEEKSQDTLDAIQRDGGKAAFVRADVSLESEIKGMIDFAARTFGRLDILVNCAAPLRGKPASFEESLEDWDHNQNVLLKAHALAARHAAPYMQEAGGGSIVNISSVTAYAITHQPCIYHVAKAGVVHLTHYLAYEFGPKNIRVNCISPGLVDREEGVPLTANPVNKAVVELSVPLRRAARPEEIAKAVVFLCSDDAGYITGHNLIIDGGLTLGEPFEVGRRAYQKQLVKS